MGLALSRSQSCKGISSRSFTILTCYVEIEKIHSTYIFISTNKGLIKVLKKNVCVSDVERSDTLNKGPGCCSSSRLSWPGRVHPPTLCGVLFRTHPSFVPPPPLPPPPPSHTIPSPSHLGPEHLLLTPPQPSCPLFPLALGLYH